jgi:hypothetical protein
MMNIFHFYERMKIWIHDVFDPPLFVMADHASFRFLTDDIITILSSQYRQKRTDPTLLRKVCFHLQMYIYICLYERKDWILGMKERVHIHFPHIADHIYIYEDSNGFQVITGNQLFSQLKESEFSTIFPKASIQIDENGCTIMII